MRLRGDPRDAPRDDSPSSLLLGGEPGVTFVAREQAGDPKVASDGGREIRKLLPCQGEIRVETASVRARDDGTLELRPFRIPEKPVGVRE